MDIYKIVDQYLADGKEGVLATIVRKSGATPQKAGAKMFVGDDGQMYGTIGGGCVEAEVWQEARQTLKAREARTFRYTLDGGSVEDEGMICGGTIEVFLEPVMAGYRDLYGVLGRSRQENRRLMTVTCFGKGLFSKTIITAHGEVIGDPIGEGDMPDRNLFHEKGPRVFDGKIVEPADTAAHLTIYGAGHISRFICGLAKMMDFHVVVMDDRDQFANKEKFPEADEIIVDDFENISRHVPGDGDGYAVVVTRGHKHDALVLEKLLMEKCRYVGMIGSRRKIKIIYDHLEKKGFDRGLLQSVHAPIGLDINGRTPQEIALSIVSELVKIRGEKRR